MAMLPAQAPAEREPVHQIRSRRAGGPGRGLAGRSDERLVQIAREGDERAFAALYERHSAAILRYCRSLLRSAQEAEDVKQEVFVLAISALRRGAEPNAFRPWLYRVAHNACMSHMRIRRPVLVADDGVLVGPATAAEPVDGHREELRQLLDDIGSLPDVQRGALLLREMDGFSYEQVGQVLGLPPSTVRASIFRARRTLQGLAEARDADCEAIQSELCELADRRGRRARHITSHLHVCSNCRDFRDGLRRRPTVLGAVDSVTPAGLAGALLAIKGKLLGGATAGGTGAAVAGGAGGAAGVAKMSAIVASSVALLAGAGLEADRVIERSHDRGVAAVTRSTQPTAGRAAQAPSRNGAAAPSRPAEEPPGGFALQGGAPAAAPQRATAGGEHAPARARELAPRGSGPRDAATSASAAVPSSGPAPASTDGASSSGHGDERGSSESGHGPHGSGRGEEGRDRSGRSSERPGRDDESAGPRTSAPRQGGNGTSQSTGDDRPASSGGSTSGSGSTSTSGSGSGSSSGSGSASTQPRPVDEDASTPAPPDGSGSPAPMPPVVPPAPGDGDPAPPDDPTPEPGDDPPAGSGLAPDPGGGGSEPTAGRP